MCCAECSEDVLMAKVGKKPLYFFDIVLHLFDESLKAINMNLYDLNMTYSDCIYDDIPISSCVFSCTMCI